MGSVIRWNKFITMNKLEALWLKSLGKNKWNYFIFLSKWKYVVCSREWTQWLSSLTGVNTNTLYTFVHPIYIIYVYTNILYIFPVYWNEMSLHPTEENVQHDWHLNLYFIFRNIFFSTFECNCMGNWHNSISQYRYKIPYSLLWVWKYDNSIKFLIVCFGFENMTTL